MDFKQRCVGDLIAVRPEEVKPSKVLLPDWQRTLKGFVLAVGPGRQNRKGTGLEPMECKVGDYITFGAAVGMESTYDGALIRIMRDRDVDGVIDYKIDADVQERRNAVAS